MKLPGWARTSGLFLLMFVGAVIAPAPIPIGDELGLTDVGKAVAIVAAFLTAWGAGALWLRRLFGPGRQRLAASIGIGLLCTGLIGCASLWVWGAVAWVCFGGRL